MKKTYTFLSIGLVAFVILIGWAISNTPTKEEVDAKRKAKEMFDEKRIDDIVKSMEKIDAETKEKQRLEAMWAEQRRKQDLAQKERDEILAKEASNKAYWDSFEGQMELRKFRRELKQYFNRNPDGTWSPK